MTPPDGAPDPLAAALLPVLLHRIRNTTQLMSSLNAVLAIDPEAPPAGRAEDLAEASREADELGWLLGVLAGGLGADLLLERRSARGLALALELVVEAVRRAGRELELPEELPLLTPEVPSHGELCWQTAGLAWSVASGAPAGTTTRLSISAGPDGWVLALEGGSDGGGGERALTLPSPWLAFA